MTSYVADNILILVVHEFLLRWGIARFGIMNSAVRRQCAATKNVEHENLCIKATSLE